MKTRELDTQIECIACKDGHVVARVGFQEPGEVFHVGIGLHEFYCKTCGVQYSKYVMEPRAAEALRHYTHTGEKV